LPKQWKEHLASQNVAPAITLKMS